jgi:hypothetical protein
MSERMKKFREAQSDLGRKSRNLYLTDAEFEVTKSFVEDLRKPDGQRRDWFNLSPLKEDWFERVVKALDGVKSRIPEANPAQPAVSNTETVSPISTKETVADQTVEQPVLASGLPIAETMTEADLNAQLEAIVADWPEVNAVFPVAEQLAEPTPELVSALPNAEPEAERRMTQDEVDALLADLDKPIPVPAEAYVGKGFVIDGRKFREMTETKPSLREREQALDPRYARSKEDAEAMLRNIYASQGDETEECF